MNDYNDIQRLRTKVLILKDEFQKTSEELKKIFNKFKNREYLDEINEIDSLILEYQYDIEDQDYFGLDDRDEDIERLQMMKHKYVDAFDLKEKIDKDFSDIEEIAEEVIRIDIEKDLYLSTLQLEFAGSLY